MELSFAQQSIAFGWSFALGAGLGVLYGLLRFLRFSFSLGKTAVFALDLLFMLTWATAAFFFSLAFLRGFVRFYVFIGSLGGFLLYRLTIGRFLCRLYQPIVRFIGKVSQKISEKIKIFAAYLLKIAGKILYNISSGLECLKKRKNCRDQINSEKRKLHEQKKTKHRKSVGCR